MCDAMGHPSLSSPPPGQLPQDQEPPDGHSPWSQTGGQALLPLLRSPGRRPERASPSLPPGRAPPGAAGSPSAWAAHPPSQHPQGASTYCVLSSASYEHQAQALGDPMARPENDRGSLCLGERQGGRGRCPPPPTQLGPNTPLATAPWAGRAGPAARRHGAGHPRGHRGRVLGAECCETISSGGTLRAATASSWPGPRVPLSTPTSAHSVLGNPEEHAFGGAGERGPTTSPVPTVADDHVRFLPTGFQVNAVKSAQ